MKSIKESLNEARIVEFRVSFNDCKDKDGLPVSATILIAPEHKEIFKKYLEDEIGNIFANAEDWRGNIIEP